ncbi:MAG: hypothetical protein JWR89_4086 [Tardiphaga sp.]|jgi:hypothetical protein|uniref:hypothetical protein n=1 Tax=Tardiphaga sp. TaxID=1926292 RepID=UPI0026022B62|nr:hypothetical protein [Tardiphaga sp.]MDB5504184.1 hypothetical protein [Tardiphaga sp.]
MEQNDNIAELREKIAKYRVLARLTTDSETVHRIHGLVDELEARVRELEGPPRAKTD